LPRYPEGAAVIDTPLTPDHGPDPEGELLGFDQLTAEGLTPDEARAVLGPHTALTRREASDRYELLQRARRAQP
jgi:hypothetical protein